MRQSIIAGIVILGLGAFVLLRGASFTSKRDVLKVGDVKITADETQSIQIGRASCRERVLASV